ncbi:hypothetical protein [Fodinicola acaciae]|uniref:hypothetical protein n=1 Tax=Fodinicola acaciae TaxID=2681555 RepID=UPI0024846586|nr:hypothetical protein [Fodinicola acaciae]
MDHERAAGAGCSSRLSRAQIHAVQRTGTQQRRGVDPRVLDVVGKDVFASDIISLNGLDDRLMRNGALSRARDLMTDAVGADHTFFSTCGSSLSVKSAMLAVAGAAREDAGRAARAQIGDLRPDQQWRGTGVGASQLGW